MADGLRKAKLDILRHSLGLTRGTEIYRNHFVTGPGSVDYDNCMAMVSDGLMIRREGSQLTGGDDLFLVTDAGKRFVAEQGDMS